MTKRAENVQWHKGTISLPWTRGTRYLTTYINFPWHKFPFLEGKGEAFSHPYSRKSHTHKRMGAPTHTHTAARKRARMYACACVHPHAHTGRVS